jgi:hypothetical protein
LGPYSSNSIGGEETMWHKLTFEDIQRNKASLELKEFLESGHPLFDEIEQSNKETLEKLSKFFNSDLFNEQ